MFDDISKHLHVRQKYSATSHVFRLSSRCLEILLSTIFHVLFSKQSKESTRADWLKIVFV